MKEDSTYKPSCLSNFPDDYLSPQEAATILKVSADFIMNKFQHRPDVITIGGGASRFQRKYRTLRIPRHVLDAYISEARIKDN